MCLIHKEKLYLKKGRVMNIHNKIYYLLFWGMSILFLLTPTDAFSEPNDTMTPKQIYGLLDVEKYDEAIDQAKRLVENQ